MVTKLIETIGFWTKVLPLLSEVASNKDLHALRKILKDQKRYAQYVHNFVVLSFHIQFAILY
jgi:hypothetical protein